MNYGNDGHIAAAEEVVDRMSGGMDIDEAINTIPDADEEDRAEIRSAVKMLINQ